MTSLQHDLHNKVLTLPKSDFPSLQSSSIDSRSNKNKNKNNNDADADADAPLLLVSLPKNLDLKDLSSSQFFISEENGCRLINESKGVTFDLIRVESSNAYVMFPPLQSTLNESTSNKSTSPNHAEGEGPPSKRMKTADSETTTKTTTTMEGRLLREKNTFFMECEIPKKTNLYQLVYDYLHQYCVYTHQSTNVGKSVLELSERFLYSQREVYDVLKKMHAFPIPNGTHNGRGNMNMNMNMNMSMVTGGEEQCDVSNTLTKYGVLSEEIERDTWDIILSVLAEWEGGTDYAKKGVNVGEMVKMVMKEDEENLEEGVVNYCIKQCQVNVEEDDVSSNTGSAIVKLDPNYIARKLAHQLFNSQIAPWKQSRFLSEWHRLMPGVGQEYEPTMDLLAGIAISVSTVSPIHQDQTANDSSSNGHRNFDSDDQKDTELYWKYFPKKALPSSDEKRMRVMFEAKEKWKLEEIQPYFDEQMKGLLMKYAQKIDGDNGGVWYLRK